MGSKLGVICGVADALRERGIVYVPDFLANCGGLIRADAERRGDEAAVERRLVAAGARTHEVLDRARREGRSPRLVGEDVARARIAAAAD